ncbi:MAG TPA: SRPBCC family protein, partial [Streptosporangiaceae bacterium]|nr:SRPBCC family protein [Streptosporangiaceae bacterium]
MEDDQIRDEVRGHVTGTRRTVAVDGDTGRTMTLRRHYRADPDDVWQACTDPARLARWLTPVSGDLRPGGRFQLAGNAGGEILRCEPPRVLTVTWEAPGGQPVTRVEAEFVAVGGGTDLELRHGGPVDPSFWAQFGPGAVGVG